MVSRDVSGKIALVTGANGLIGKAVSQRLLEDGAHVRAFVRRPDSVADLVKRGAELVEGDVTDSEAVRRGVRGCDLVLHFAGVLARRFEPRSRYWAVNVEATRSIAAASAIGGVELFLLASSAWAYGFDAGSSVVDEHTEPRGLWESYSASKLAAEKLVLELAARGLPAVIVQPSPVYGPFDESWTLLPARMIAAGRMVLPGGGRGLIQPIFIDDVAEGVMAALREGRPGERYLLCGERVLTIAEFFACYGAMLGRGRMLPVPVPLCHAVALASDALAAATGHPGFVTRTAVYGTTMSCRYDGSKASRDLGFRPATSLDEGMAAVRAWLEQQGLVVPASAAGSPTRSEKASQS